MSTHVRSSIYKMFDNLPEDRRGNGEKIVSMTKE